MLRQCFPKLILCLFENSVLVYISAPLCEQILASTQFCVALLLHSVFLASSPFLPLS